MICMALNHPNFNYPNLVQQHPVHDRLSSHTLYTSNHFATNQTNNVIGDYMQGHYKWIEVEALLGLIHVPSQTPQMPTVDAVAIQAVLAESEKKRQYDPFVRHKLMLPVSR